MATRRIGLEEKLREFAGQYIIDFNARAAYERCHCYKATGSAAKVSGFKLLQRDDVQQYIREAMEARKNRLQIDQDAVVIEWARIGFADIRNYVVWNFDTKSKEHALLLRDSEDLTEDQSRAIQEVSIDSDGKIKFKLHAKLTALDALAKHLDMYRQTVEHIVEDKRSDVVGQMHEMLKQTRSRLQSRADIQDSTDEDEPNP